VAVRSVRAEFGEEAVRLQRMWSLTTILMRHPSLVHDLEDAYRRLALPEDLARLRDDILHADEAALLDSESLLAHLKLSGSAEIAARARSHLVASARCLRPDAMPAEAEAEWWQMFGFLHRPHLEEEIALAERACAVGLDKVSQDRLTAMKTALLALDEDLGEA